MWVSQLYAPLAPTHHLGLGDVVRVEAWIIRDLVYCFSRVIKRGHRPREEELVQLMESCGIPVPEPSPGRRSSGPLGFASAQLFLVSSRYANIP